MEYFQGTKKMMREQLNMKADKRDIKVFRKLPSGTSLVRETATKKKGGD